MDMQASRQLAVTQQQAWDALNDPEVLKRCIPGCDKVEATGEGQYAVGVAVKIGPVSAKFNGKITLSDIVPPQSYTITFDGQGGAAGFGKGNAKVTLTPQPGLAGTSGSNSGDGCELAYVVHASVGGKVAQLGQRLIDGAAKSMAEDFFKRFDEEMQRQHPQAYAARAEAAAAATAAEGDAAAVPSAAVSPAPNSGVPAWVWVAGIVVVAAVAAYILR